MADAVARTEGARELLALAERIGLAIEEAWNGSGSEGQRNDLPPIDLTAHERRHLGFAALAAMKDQADA